MKMRVAFFAMVLLPVAASAQAPPSVPRPAGITVAGSGSVRIAVKTVQFTAQARGNIDEASALAALRVAGVDDPAVGPVGPRISNGTQVLVRGTVRGVTHAKLDGIGVAAAAYVAAHPGVTLDSVTFSPRLDDCLPSEQTARAAALADARRRADAIAALAGVSIDGVAAVNENGGCPISPDNSFNGAVGPLDLGTLTSTITVYEFVTFAISPGPAPARRRTL